MNDKKKKKILKEGKQETIIDTVNTKETKKLRKSQKNRTRMLLVLLFIAIFAVISYVQLRGSYLEYLELGESYTSIFFTNLIFKYSIMVINFVILYFVIYFTNRGIKKGLQPFFEKEKKQMPKLLNKSLALVISAIVSVIVSSVFMQKIMLISGNTAFGIQDPIFNMDISYYVFQKPLIEMFVMYFIVLVVGLTLYMSLYYIIVFNKYFDGIEGKMLKESIFMKKLLRNILLVAIGIAIMTILNIQSMVFGKILTINEDLEIIGAGITESTIKLWGYVIFAIVIIIFAYRAIRAFKNQNTGKVLKNLAIIPAYLIILFLAMVIFDLVYVNNNELDKERKYISANIANTKNAYDINIDEENMKNSGTITQQEVNVNEEIINNIPVISKDMVLQALENSKTETGYFSYRNANLAKYNINGQDALVYIAPREITSSGRTYNNKTYEYTHGIGQIVVSATQSNENGNVQYIQKEVSGNDEVLKTFEPRIYFGTETEETIATNAKNKQEYDYTDENGQDYTSTYTGTAGLQLGFLDRLVLGITKGDLNLAFSGEISNDSKILINRDIISRAKKALPYLIYDENPYTVVRENGDLVWVLDAYTISNCYPYSQYTSIEHDGIRENINYIRNSVKLIIDAYDGTMSFYITDRADPIAMAYRNIYPDLFVDLEEEIPEDISKHFVYPEFLYEVQSEILKVYHNVKTDVLYRADDVWDFAKYNSVKSTKSTGTYMEPYYTMVKVNDEEEIGLMQIYTPDEKQNIISYLVGTTNGAENKLNIYKFSADSDILGPMQLDKQIEEDEAISSEIETLNVTGTKITKKMIVVPIENTLLYVEPIYQTMLNESDVPILKKVVVASGNKVSIGDSLQQALSNLLSQYAIDIEVENTDDIEGVIDAIIKANKNLTESNQNNDWELMGSDIKKLQELIDSLEQLRDEENKKKEEDAQIISNENDENIENLEDNSAFDNDSSNSSDINEENKN